MAARDRGPLSTPSKKFAAGSAAVFIALWLAFQFNLFKAPGLSRSVAIAVIVGTLALALGLLAWALLLRRKEAPRFSEEEIRPHADLLAEVRWRGLLVRVVVVCVLAPFVDWSMIHGFDLHTNFRDGLPAEVFFIALASLAINVARVGRGVDDELTASFRAEAWKAGFMALLIASSVAYIISHDDRWFSLSLTAAMPYVLALGASAMAVRFAWLERAAAKNV